MVSIVTAESAGGLKEHSSGAPIRIALSFPMGIRVRVRVRVRIIVRVRLRVIGDKNECRASGEG
jgi:hypothetical protein